MKKKYPKSTIKYDLVDKHPLGIELQKHQRENFAIMHQNYDEALVLVVALFLEYESEAVGDLTQSVAAEMLLCNLMYSVMTLYSFVVNENKETMLKDARDKVGRHITMNDVEYVMIQNCVKKVMDTIQSVYNAYMREEREKNN